MLVMFHKLLLLQYCSISNCTEIYIEYIIDGRNYFICDSFSYFQVFHFLIHLGAELRQKLRNALRNVESDNFMASKVCIHHLSQENCCQLASCSAVSNTKAPSTTSFLCGKIVLKVLCC